MLADMADWQGGKLCLTTDGCQSCTLTSIMTDALQAPASRQQRQIICYLGVNEDPWPRRQGSSPDLGYLHRVHRYIQPLQHACARSTGKTLACCDASCLSPAWVKSTLPADYGLQNPVLVRHPHVSQSSKPHQVPHRRQAGLNPSTRIYWWPI